MTKPVRDVVAAWPATVQARTAQLRQLVFEVAEETESGPLTETLKWGQPAYLTEATRAGTTIRLGYSAGEALPCRLLVHCGTTLIDEFRHYSGDELSFDGNRAIKLAESGRIPEVAIRDFIRSALTYHRSKTRD